MIDEKYKWIYSYTLPCTRLGDEEMFWSLLESSKVLKGLGGDYSRENVRKYFLVGHNFRELHGMHKKDGYHRFAAYQHLAVPYQVVQSTENHLFCELEDSLSELPLGNRKVFGFRQLEFARQRGVLRRGDEIIISHAGIIAESCSKKDSAEYSKIFNSLADVA